MHDSKQYTSEIYPFNSLFFHELAHFIQKRGIQLGKSDVLENKKHKRVAEPELRHNRNYASNITCNLTTRQPLSHNTHIISCLYLQLLIMTAESEY